MTLCPAEGVEIVDDVDRAILPWRYGGRTRAPSVGVRTIRGITVSRLHGGPCAGWRDRSVIGGEDRTYIAIGCALGGGERCMAGESETLTQAGDVWMWRSDAELAFEVPDEIHKLTIMMSAQRFPGWSGTAAMPAVWHLGGDTPMGRVASRMFIAIAESFSDLGEGAMEIALDSAIDLVSRALRLDPRADADPRAALYKRVLADLEHRLRDEVVPAEVAARHGVSLRYLQALFAEHGPTLTHWLRDRRLQRALDELMDVSGKTSISEIAHRWRFSDGAHFSRLFKERFGLTPSDARYRRSARRSPSAPGS